MNFMKICRRRYKYLISIPKIFRAIVSYNNDLPWSKGYAKLTNDYRQMIVASFPTEFILPKLLFHLVYRSTKSTYWVSLGSQSHQGNLESFIKYVLPKIDRKFVLLLSDGDRCILTDIDQNKLHKLLNNKYLKRIYCQNAPNGFHEKLLFLPIGLDLHTNRSDLIGLQKLDCFNAIAAIEMTRQERVIADCLARPTSSLRTQLRSAFQGAYQDKLVIPTNLTEPELWRLYKASTTILSISGNGYDCHRTWEALFLGCHVFCDKNLISKQLEDFGPSIFDHVADLQEKSPQITHQRDPKILWYSYLQKIQSDIKSLT